MPTELSDSATTDPAANRRPENHTGRPAAVLSPGTDTAYPTIPLSRSPTTA